jgi:hypothetical protein
VIKIEQLRLAGGQHVSNKNSKIENPPDVKYDSVIFGAPVHGFFLSKVMTIYLNQIPSLAGKMWHVSLQSVCHLDGLVGIVQLVKKSANLNGL